MTAFRDRPESVSKNSSDATRHELHLEPALLDTIIERALSSMDAERGHHRIDYVHPPEAVRIRGDPYRLEQVIANLVENALGASGWRARWAGAPPSMWPCPCWPPPVPRPPS